MLGEALEGLEAQVETGKIRIGRLEPRHDADGVRVVIEPPCGRKRSPERILAGMSERRMAKVVRKTKGFGEVLIETKSSSHRASDLGNFEAVGEPHPVMVAVGSDEDLRLVPESPEPDRVDQPVAITLENVSRPARAGIEFGMKAAA